MKEMLSWKFNTVFTVSVEYNTNAIGKKPRGRWKNISYIFWFLVWVVDS